MQEQPRGVHGVLCCSDDGGSFLSPGAGRFQLRILALPPCLDDGLGPSSGVSLP